MDVWDLGMGNVVVIGSCGCAVCWRLDNACGGLGSRANKAVVRVVEAWAKVLRLCVGY